MICYGNLVLPVELHVMESHTVCFCVGGPHSVPKAESILLVMSHCVICFCGVFLRAHTRPCAGSYTHFAPVYAPAVSEGTGGRTSFQHFLLLVLNLGNSGGDVVSLCYRFNFISGQKCWAPTNAYFLNFLKLQCDSFPYLKGKRL